MYVYYIFVWCSDTFVFLFMYIVDFLWYGMCEICSLCLSLSLSLLRTDFALRILHIGFWIARPF